MEFKANLKQKVGERTGESQGGPWKIASYLLETVEMYPKRMVVEVSDGQMGRCSQWDELIGKNVVIQFSIDAREWQGRWYNTLRAWAIHEDIIDTSTASTSGQENSPRGVMAQAKASGQSEAPEADAPQEGDDLPF